MLIKIKIQCKIFEGLILWISWINSKSYITCVFFPLKLNNNQDLRNRRISQAILGMGIIIVVIEECSFFMKNFQNLRFTLSLSIIIFLKGRHFV